MLAGQHDAVHAGIAKCCRPLVRVEFSWRKRCRLFRAVAPFAVAERIHAEVHERIAAGRLPCELPGTGANSAGEFDDRCW
jgi:hypothetical protein